MEDPMELSDKVVKRMYTIVAAAYADRNIDAPENLVIDEAFLVAAVKKYAYDKAYRSERNKATAGGARVMKAFDALPDGETKEELRRQLGILNGHTA